MPADGAPHTDGSWSTATGPFAERIRRVSGVFAVRSYPTISGAASTHTWRNGSRPGRASYNLYSIKPFSQGVLDLQHLNVVVQEERKKPGLALGAWGWSSSISSSTASQLSELSRPMRPV